MVAEAVDRPLEQRVMDPACGSGTFLFHAVRAVLDAADAAGLAKAEAVRRAAANIAGIDIHPVAVIIARVTYLLALIPALRHGASRQRNGSGVSRRRAAMESGADQRDKGNTARPALLATTALEILRSAGRPYRAERRSALMRQCLAFPATVASDAGTLRSGTEHHDRACRATVTAAC